MWAAIVLLVIPGNLDYTGTAADGGDANPVSRTIWMAILGAGAAIAFSRLALCRRVVRQLNVFFILFLALAVASILWSIDPGQTTRRVARMMILCTASLGVALAGWHPRRYQALVRPPLTALLLGSIVFGLVAPDLAIHQSSESQLHDSWHGLFLTKNDLGPAASFAFVLWTHAFFAREGGGRLVSLGAMVVCGLCVFLSRSSASLMATVFTVLALALLMRTPGSMRRSMKYLTSALVVMILLYSMAMLKIVPGLEILLSPVPMITGKDLTFSGRAEIWSVVLDHWRLRPVFGSGYAAFWVVGRPTPDMESYAVLAPLQFYPGNSHNGYLQVLNDLGVVGLIFLLGYLVVYLRQSIRLYLIDRSQGALYLGLLLQQAMLNLTEPLWLNAQLLDFLLMTAATTCLARALADAQAAKAVVRRAAPLAAAPIAARSGPKPLGLRRLLRPPVGGHWKAPPQAWERKPPPP